MRRNYFMMVFDVFLWGILASGLAGNIIDGDFAFAAIDFVFGLIISNHIQN